MRSRFVRAIVVLAALAGGACGGDEGPSTSPSPADAFSGDFSDAEVYPVVVSSELVMGPNRVLLGLLDDQDRRVASPDIRVAASFYDLSRSSTEPVSSAAAEFVWTIRPVQGLYVLDASFDKPGRWGIEVSIEGEGFDEKLKSDLEVKSTGSTPALGAPAPPSDTPTIADRPLKRLTTDPRPDRRFYEMSIAQAVRSGRPSVIVFSTPKFCTSEVCGPTLDVVKSVVPRFPKAVPVHVEVYELPADPSNLQTVPAVDQWGLPSEPWVFVTDADGRVVAKFEGAVGASELRRTLAGLF